MAGAYVKEFEKWLQGNKKESESEDCDSVNMDDSGDEVDNYSTNNMVKEQNKQAPILFNGQNGSDYFQDEPPVLEPIPSAPHAKLSDSKESENDFDHMQVLSKTEKNVVDNVKDNQKISLDSEKCFTKSKESENIFDKFSLLSEVDDYPPPLIPSHEAHLTTVDAKDDDSLTEKSYAILQNLSPNFCAMEADSTSEVLKGDQDDSSYYVRPKGRHSTKTFVSSDVGMECDSTCMLGASPQVVSPGSCSNVEWDNQTPNHDESLISMDENSTVNWDTFTTNKPFHLLPPSSEEAQVEDLNTHRKMTSGHSKSSHHFAWDKECPKLEAVNEGKERVRHKPHADVDDPPVLSVIPSRTIKSSMAARRKRHTIDTIESISKSKQRLHSRSKESKYNVDHRIHPVASYSTSKSEDVSLNGNGEQKFSSSKRKDISSHTHSPNHSRPRKHRKRCQTLPIVDLVSYGSHLPKDLYKFIVNSSQLYRLQNRMYKLVSLLFPQLLPDLDKMSPDSYRFEMLLKDLLFYLAEQKDDSNESVKLDRSFSNLDHCFLVKEDDRKQYLTHAMSNKCLEDRMETQGNHVSPLVTDKNAARKKELSLDDSLETDDLRQHSSVSGSLVCENVKSNFSCLSIVSDSMIPKFSGLSLTEEHEKVLKCQPSVLIHKNPSAVHNHFFKLSCCTLQRLLPDLEVSLFRELANSPNDLLYFIDSVIASNSC